MGDFESISFIFCLHITWECVWNSQLFFFFQTLLRKCNHIAVRLLIGEVNRKRMRFQSVMFSQSYFFNFNLTSYLCSIMFLLQYFFFYSISGFIPFWFLFTNIIGVNLFLVRLDLMFSTTIYYMFNTQFFILNTKGTFYSYFCCSMLVLNISSCWHSTPVKIIAVFIDVEKPSQCWRQRHTSYWCCITAS